MDISRYNVKYVNGGFRFRRPLIPRGKSGRKILIVHHSASDASSTEPRDIHSWHLHRKWAGIGYHFVITPDGVVVSGRPYDKVGAHCDGKNSCTGVCLIGDFTKEKPTQSQLDALSWLISYLNDLEGGVKVFRHCDFNPTSCPGRNFPWPIHVKKNINDTAEPKQMPLVKRGMGGHAVAVLQKELKRRGFNVEVDGVFGPKTEAAVKRFQRKCKMRVDGIAGRKTWAALGYGFKG